MELLFQAWDELDDWLAALRYVLWRYAGADVGRVAAATLGALKGTTREAAAPRRRNPRMRPA